MPNAKSPKRPKVKSHSRPVTDAHERCKDFLGEAEVIALLDGAKAGRHGARDHLILLTMYRHGLRVSEAVGSRRDEIDLDRARLWVRRLKNGLSVEYHRDPKHTIQHTQFADNRFEEIWGR